VIDDLKEEEAFAAEYVHLQQFGAFSEVLNRSRKRSPSWNAASEAPSKDGS
jgi:hypothetical protein